MRHRREIGGCARIVPIPALKMSYIEPGKQQSSHKAHLQLLCDVDSVMVAENINDLFNAVSVMG